MIACQNCQKCTLQVLKNSVLTQEDLCQFFQEMTIEYCSTDDFCDSINRDEKKEAIKTIKRILDIKFDHLKTCKNMQQQSDELDVKALIESIMGDYMEKINNTKEEEERQAVLAKYLETLVRIKGHFQEAVDKLKTLVEEAVLVV